MPEAAYRDVYEDYTETRSPYTGRMGRDIVELKEDVKALKRDMGEIKGDIRVMNERIDKNLADYKLIAADIENIVTESRGESRESSARIEGKIEALTARVESLQHRRYWDIAWFGIIVTGTTAVIQMFSK